jgi:hypothetical protein
MPDKLPAEGETLASFFKDLKILKKYDKTNLVFV